MIANNKHNLSNTIKYCRHAKLNEKPIVYNFDVFIITMYNEITYIIYFYYISLLFLIIKHADTARNKMKYVFHEIKMKLLEQVLFYINFN